MSTVSVHINRPASDVFRFVCDWRNYRHLWVDSIQIRTPESLAETRLGQTTEFAHTSGKVVTHVICVVTRLEEGRLVEWDTKFPKVLNAGKEENPPLPNVRATCEFIELGAMTLFKLSTTVHGDFPWAMKFMMRAILLIQRRALAKGLRAIKAQLE